ncbi:uncharacterized protein KNN_06964 (plasmid) [Bacillus thuringiensis serovar tolworthi]|uniref:PA14 domain-containing protein n=3 Tax=Bacillus cereus group TaxID=86661 RepID=A0A9W4A917_BACTO|nr:binary toxin-like calcium binding domain-containing protein [Bacillus thuringiensis]MEB9595773.1 PA14 domain-containing protein [Bacillus cereus]BAR87697.1 uncharacterized protein KNN_06964 [Bacillus thuringiensis serovar tolworthi]
MNTNFIKNGLLGYYYGDKYFHDLELIHITQKGGTIHLFKEDSSSLFTAKKSIIQSARWVGFLRPSITGHYQLSTSHNAHVIMTVNGKNVISECEYSESLHLIEGKMYEICIEFQQQDVKFSDVLLDFHIYWSRDNHPLTIIPLENLVQPQTSDRNRTQRQKNIPRHSLFSEKYPMDPAFQRRASDDVDSDDDAIPDNWEINGFTVRENLIVKWEDSFASRGYKKYRSNPYRAHTVGDPYSDFEKVASQMDPNVKKEARNPLVAAVPEVRVDMESFKVIKIDNIGHDTSQTVTEEASYSTTSAITAGITTEASATLLDFGMRVSTSFSQTTSSTAEYGNSTSESWSEQLNFNTSDRARLNANVRYHNTGSAPIYKVQPTSSFVLQDGSSSGYTIRTVKAKENQVGEVLNPGSTYPEGGAPISLDKIDDFGSTDITIDKETLDKLEKNGKLDLQTPQAEGFYKLLNASGGTNLYPGFASIQNDVRGRSAHIILNTENGTVDRRIATKQYSDREDLTPEITLKEAIKMAYDAEETNGILKIKIQHGQETEEIELDPYNLGGKIIVDEKTSAEFTSQLDKMSKKNIFNVKLKMLEDVVQKTGMNILIQERKPATDLKEGIYSIQTSMNTQFGMRNSDGLIQMDYAVDLDDRKFEIAWIDSVKAYSIYLVGTDQALSIDKENRIILKPFNNTDQTQHWNIQRTGKNTYIIESLRYPLHCMDVEKAWTAPLPGANVILYKQNGNANQQWRFSSPIVIPENTIKNNYNFYQWQGQGKEYIGGIYFKVSDYNILNLIERYKIEIYGYDYEFPWGKPIKHEFISNGIIRISTGGTYGTYGKPIRVWAIDKNGRYTLILDRFVKDGDAIIRIDKNKRNKEQEIHNTNNVKLQLNFYNSTCNIYYHGDHHTKKQNNE